MYRHIVTAVLFAVLFLGAGFVLAAKDPAPGSRDDPLITKSYADNIARWQRVQVPAGGSIKLREGTEFVVVFSGDSLISVEAEEKKLEKVWDLTLGSRLIESKLSPGHHYISSASGDFSVKFESEAQVLIRNGA